MAGDSLGRRIRVLLVPDSIYWVCGTIAKAIARFNPWIEPTICSGTALWDLLSRNVDLSGRVDLVHFVDPFLSRHLLPHFQDRVPCVASIHHYHDWDTVAHNTNADVVVVDSPQWQEYLVELGVPSHQVFCLPSGVDAELFQPISESERVKLRRQIGLPSEAIVIGLFAKITSYSMRRKGTDVFVQAITALKAEMPNVTALLVGPGWQYLRDQIRSRGVPCVWLPFVENHAKLAPLYRCLDQYWVTSRIEGGPVTLLEAMSSGIPCVTTPVGLAREIVTDGHNGFIVPIDDVHGFVTRSCQLAQDPELCRRMGHQARHTVLGGYQWRHTTKRLRELYSIAFERFSHRRGIPLAIDVSAASETAKACMGTGETSYLTAVPPEHRRRVRMQEEIPWMQILLRAGDPRGALRHWLRACRWNPISLALWALVARSLAPAAYEVVRRIVRRPEPHRTSGTDFKSET